MTNGSFGSPTTNTTYNYKRSSKYSYNFKHNYIHKKGEIEGEGIRLPLYRRALFLSVRKKYFLLFCIFGSIIS